jgi:hypothetical protein
MKDRISRTLAIAGLAAFAFAAPASAVNINFAIAGNELRVEASNLGADIIAAWDFDITFDPSLTIDTAFTDNQLGVSNTDTVFDFFDLGGGSLDAFEVSFLSDAALAALQNSDPFTLLTVRFNEQDISQGGFAFVWNAFNDVKCAENRVCFPPQQQAPEPGTLALLALGGLGMALIRRNRKA